MGQEALQPVSNDFGGESRNNITETYWSVLSHSCGIFGLWNENNMCFIKIWRNNTQVQEIQNSFGDTFTSKRSKVLVKERGHTIGAWRFFGMHLFESFVDFFSCESPGEEGIHLVCDHRLDCIN